MATLLQTGAKENWGDPLNHLADLEKTFEQYLPEISTLVKEYGLDESTVTEFRKRSIDVLYEKAGSYRCHAWQAQFAKKHGI